MFYVQNINKKYKDKIVLKDVNLNINRGECIGIVGGNGSGKTTLLSVLAGVLKPESGNFRYENVDLFKNNKKRNEILSYIPQKNPLVYELNAADNLLLWKDKKDIEKSLSSGVAKVLGINEFLSKKVFKLSIGMQKRLAIACAINENTKLLLLDEPSAGLDLQCKESLYKYFKKFKENGKSIIIVSHETMELEICDRYLLLKDADLKEYSYTGDIHKLSESL